MSCRYFRTDGLPCKCGEPATDGLGHYGCVGPPGDEFVVGAFIAHMADARAETEVRFESAIKAALKALPDREARMRVIKSVCRDLFGVQVEIY